MQKSTSCGRKKVNCPRRFWVKSYSASLHTALIVGSSRLPITHDMNQLLTKSTKDDPYSAVGQDHMRRRWGSDRCV